MDYFDLLPDELVVEIFTYCNVEDLSLNIRKTCRRFSTLVEDAEIWRDKIFCITPWLDKDVAEIIAFTSRLTCVVNHSQSETVMEHFIENTELDLKSLQLLTSKTVCLPILKRALKHYPKLKRFGILLRDCNVEEYLELFDQLQCLEELKIGYSGRDREFVQKLLLRCSMVHHLDLSGTGYFWINDDDIKTIIDMQKDVLRYLSINGLCVSSKSLDLLKQCTQLEQLHIKTSQISQNELKALQDITALRSLHLDQAQNISFEFLNQFFATKNFKNLTSLEISDTHFSDVAAVALTSNCRKLKVLCLKILENSSNEEVIQGQATSCNELVSSSTFTNIGFNVIISNCLYLNDLRIFCSAVISVDRNFILNKLRYLNYCKVEGRHLKLVWPNSSEKLEMLLQYY